MHSHSHLFSFHSPYMQSIGESSASMEHIAVDVGRIEISSRIERQKWRHRLKGIMMNESGRIETRLLRQIEDIWTGFLEANRFVFCVSDDF